MIGVVRYHLVSHADNDFKDMPLGVAGVEKRLYIVIRDPATFLYYLNGKKAQGLQFCIGKWSAVTQCLDNVVRHRIELRKARVCRYAIIAFIFIITIAFFFVLRLFMGIASIIKNNSYKRSNIYN